MNIYLNGELREVPENLTLTALLDWLKLPADRVAVERNREIASRSTWDETITQSGDRLEVVHFVGGGVEETGVRSSKLEFRYWKLE
jgi:sulfur carrier protein